MQVIEEIAALIRAARDIIALDLLDDYIPVEDEINEAYRTFESDAASAVNDWQKDKDDDRLTRRIMAGIAILLPLVVISARTLQRSGTRRGINFGRDVLSNVGTPPIFSLSRIAATIDYVDSPTFTQIVNGLLPHYSDRIGAVIINGQANGLNPREVAAQIMRLFVGDGGANPALRADIERLTRTLQVYASRRATGQVYRATGIEQWIWSAALDDRTCMMCVAMHGTVHELEREPYLNDHHNGRCAMVPVNERVRELGFSGAIPRYETGVQWLAGQPASRQRLILGPTLYDAYVDGSFVFSPDKVTTTYTNPLFGEMRRPDTITNILGAG